MRLLLDTHLLIWAAYEQPTLSKRARALIADPTTELEFSAVSIWEMAIKQALGRKDFEVDTAGLRRGLLANDYAELPLTSGHGLAVLDLLDHHRDPFDRLLVAQAKTERMALLTADERMTAYGDFVVRV